MSAGDVRISGREPEMAASARPCPATDVVASLARLGIVVIGRNEGERLYRCLNAIIGRCPVIVYVDSGSTDGSVALARSLGVEVVELDHSAPFSAARARNAGFERLRRLAPYGLFVQFVDGDCELDEAWLERGVRELESRDDLAVVCGRRRERFPDRSIYNRLADLEWDTPVGEAEACGGDAMMRVDAFEAVGGFDPTVTAGEEPELCGRLRRAGQVVLRVDAEMSRHDLGVTSFGPWWRRQIRSGYGSLDVTRRGGGTGPFARQVRSVQIWTVGWLAATVVLGIAALALSGPLAGAWAVSASGVAPTAQALRLAAKVRKRAGGTRTALAYGVLTMIGKWGELVGQVGHLYDRAAGRRSSLIEYKQIDRPVEAAVELPS